MLKVNIRVSVLTVIYSICSFMFFCHPYPAIMQSHCLLGVNHPVAGTLSRRTSLSPSAPGNMLSGAILWSSCLWLFLKGYTAGLLYQKKNGSNIRSSRTLELHKIDILKFPGKHLCIKVFFQLHYKCLPSKLFEQAFNYKDYSRNVPNFGGRAA